MQQVSPNRQITYTVKHEDWKGATVRVRPPTQPQRGALLWAMGQAQDGKGNMVDVAYDVCRKLVVSWDGAPGAPKDFDLLPFQIATEVMAFIAHGCEFTEEDAGN